MPTKTALERLEDYYRQSNDEFPPAETPEYLLFLVALNQERRLRRLEEIQDFDRWPPR